MPVRVYGAGMAGLLVAAMLRRLQPRVYEAQATLPDNHGALLRFRTSGVEQATGLPFRKVRVLKAVKSGGRLRPIATIRDANLYSHKVTGAVQPRSVLNLDACDRYIAPEDFISAMARDVVLKMETPLTREVLEQNKAEGITTISTIPMPRLMQMVGWDNPGFQWRPIWSVIVHVQEPALDVYQTIYYPEPDVPYYRASITGDKVIIEYLLDPATLKPHINRSTAPRNTVGGVREDLGMAPTITPVAYHQHVHDVLDDFGVTDQSKFTVTAPKRQEYGKLVPLERDVRQTFILAMTDQYNCYSVGRFATWRQILLDDVVNDVRVVEAMVTQRNAYVRRLHAAGRPT
jgi:hypothetical protein